jgi:hypothetical protein
MPWAQIIQLVLGLGSLVVTYLVHQQGQDTKQSDLWRYLATHTASIVIPQVQTAIATGASWESTALAAARDVVAWAQTDPYVLGRGGLTPDLQGQIGEYAKNTAQAIVRTAPKPAKR